MMVIGTYEKLENKLSPIARKANLFVFEDGITLNNKFERLKDEYKNYSDGNSMMLHDISILKEIMKCIEKDKDYWDEKIFHEFADTFELNVLYISHSVA